MWATRSAARIFLFWQQFALISAWLRQGGGREAFRFAQGLGRSSVQRQ